MLDKNARQYVADRACYEGEDPSLVRLLPDDLALPYTLPTAPNPDVPWVNSGIDFAAMAEEYGPWEVHGIEPDRYRAVLYWDAPGGLVYAVGNYTEGDIAVRLFPTLAHRAAAMRTMVRGWRGGV
jgi:hypothetical protein